MGDAPVEQSGSSDDVIKLRHEAGLTAGRSFPMRRGTFRFGPDAKGSAGLSPGEPTAVSFLLSVERRDHVMVSRGDEPLAVEGVPVTDPVSAFPGDIIQLGTDHFSVESVSWPSFREPPDEIAVEAVPPLVQRRRWLPPAVWFVLLAIGFGLAIVNRWWLLLAAVAGLGILIDVVWHRRRSRRAEERRASDEALASRRLAYDLQRVRSTEARALRAAHPGPAAIADLVQETSSWPAHRNDGDRWRIAVASGDIEWAPPLIHDDQPGWMFERVVSTYDFLPAVPFTVGLDNGPIGIAGPAAATSAMARHLFTSAMTQIHPRHLRVSLGKSAAEDESWTWLTDTAHSRSDHELASLLRGPVGGRRHLRLMERAERTSPVAEGTVQVFLAERAEDLPDACSIALFVSDDGTASARMLDGKIARGLAPQGITELHGREIVRRLGNRDLIDQGRTRRLGAASDPAPTPLPGAATLAGIGGASEAAGEAVSETPDRPERIARVIDLRDHAGTEPAEQAERLLVRAADPALGDSTTARSILEAVADDPETKLFIVDRGDRKLIRLAQLPQCRRYAAIDDHRSLERLLRTIEQTLTSEPDTSVAVLIAGLPTTLGFLQQAGRRDLGSALAALCQRKTPRLLIAASGDLVTALDAEVLAAFPEGARSPQSSPPAVPMTYLLPEPAAAGTDLTGAVAEIKRLTREHARREAR